MGPALEAMISVVVPAGPSYGGACTVGSPAQRRRVDGRPPPRCLPQSPSASVEDASCLGQPTRHWALLVPSVGGPLRIQNGAQHLGQPSVWGSHTSTPG